MPVEEDVLKVRSKLEKMISSDSAVRIVIGFRDVVYFDIFHVCFFVSFASILTS